MTLMPEVGGPTPLPVHHVLTFRGPEDVGPGCDPTSLVPTTYSPLESWTPIIFVGWQATPCADGETPMAFTMHPVSMPLAPVAAILVSLCDLGCGGHSVIELCYTGAEPAIGSQVVADGSGCVRSPSTGELGIGMVMEIIDDDTDGTKRLELLI